MHFTTVLITLATSVAPALADCSADWAKPDEGDIALYRDTNCNGPYLNVGAMDSCVSWPNFNAASAVTNNGVLCGIYRNDDCGGYVTTVDSDGFRNFDATTIQSVFCTTA